MCVYMCVCVFVSLCVCKFVHVCAARVMALNTKTLGRFDPTVRMWVHEEEVEGRNLTDIINTDHENPK